MPTKVKITEELLQTHLAEWFEPRILNLLEKKDVTTLQDLLYCCGRTYPCKKCEDRKGCEKVKIIGIEQSGIRTLQIILDRLEEVGIIERQPTEEKPSPTGERGGLGGKRRKK